MKSVNLLFTLLPLFLFQQSHGAKIFCSQAVSSGFSDPQSLRDFRLQGVNKPYREILELNNLEFVSEEVIDGDIKNGYRVFVRYKGLDISFMVSENRFFTSKSQQAIEGAIRAFEMTQNPKLIPSNATARTKFYPRSVLKKLPPAVQRWLARETQSLSREVDVKLTRGFAPIRNFQETAFKPETSGVFEMKAYWFGENVISMVLGAPSETQLPDRFKRIRNGKTEYLFPVHPESYEYYKDLILKNVGIETFIAAASASSRSLVVWKEGNESSPFIAKVSLDRQIGNIVRILDNEEVIKSMATDLMMANAKNEFTPDLLFIREVAGFMIKGKSQGGAILREFPPEMLESPNTHTPLFAFYGTSTAKQIPLLVKLILKSKKSTVDYVRLDIVRPLARAWVKLALKHFLVLEPHAQNAEVDVTSDHQLSGLLIFRDNGGFSFDVNARRKKGLLVPENNEVIGKSLDTIFSLSQHEKKYSDSLGKYLEGGFLSQIETKCIEWVEKGLLPGKPLEVGFIRETLLSEVEIAIFEITGNQVKLSRDYSNLNQVMTGLVTLELQKK